MGDRHRPRGSRPGPHRPPTPRHPALPSCPGLFAPGVRRRAGTRPRDGPPLPRPADLCALRRVSRPLAPARRRPQGARGAGRGRAGGVRVVHGLRLLDRTHPRARPGQAAGRADVARQRAVHPARTARDPRHRQRSRGRGPGRVGALERCGHHGVQRGSLASCARRLGGARRTSVDGCPSRC